MGDDPYRIADVAIPWTWYDDSDGYDDTEWPRPDDSARIIAKVKSDEASNRVRQYLAMNGAAVWARVERSLADANGARDTNPAASIVAAVTAAELTIRFLLLRPLVAGLVFNTKLAMKLVREGPAGTERDRRLLPDACRAWGLDLDTLMVPNGQPLWESLRALIEVRNKYVHRAEPVLGEQAAGAIDCAEGFIDQVVRPLGARLGLEWPPTGWTHRGRTHDPVVAAFDYMGS
jgi:hypothetical protein